MNIMKYEFINFKNRYLVESVYLLTPEELEDILIDNKFQEKIVEFSKNKNDFIRWISKKREINKNITSFFTKVLLYAERKFNIDLACFTKEQVEEMFIIFKENKLITSRSTYDSYLNSINMYTTWAYYSRIRRDIITARKLNLCFKEYVDSEYLASKVVTREKFIYVAQNFDNPLLEIGIRSAWEGIKTSEFLELTLENVKKSDVENNILKLQNRELVVAPNFLERIQEASKITEVEVHFKNYSRMQDLNKTEYLFRTTSLKSNKVTQSSFAGLIKREMNKQECELSYRDVRVSSMLNDIIDGKDLDFINNKFGLKHREKGDIIASNRSKYDVLIKKRES